MGERAKIVRRRGRWFVTGEEWSGSWRTEEAAELARDGEYTLAHDAHRKAGPKPGRAVSPESGGTTLNEGNDDEA